MKFRVAVALSLLCALFGGYVGAEDAPPNTPADKQQKSKAVAKPTKQAAISKAAAPDTTATPADAPKSNDRLVLDATVVTGNRELPKVMYIVPWKKADLGTLPGQPFNTLLDETLAPVDREVFRREVQYYEVISGKDQPPADQATPKSDSK
jgi:hypothetical protein